jgi:hypothetical protein
MLGIFMTILLLPLQTYGSMEFVCVCVCVYVCLYVLCVCVPECVRARVCMYIMSVHISFI